MSDLDLTPPLRIAAEEPDADAEETQQQPSLRDLLAALAWLEGTMNGYPPEISVSVTPFALERGRQFDLSFREESGEGGSHYTIELTRRD